MPRKRDCIVNMKLVVITRPEYFVVEHLLIREFFNEGLDILYLRKNDGDTALCERLLGLLPDYCREKTVILDNFELKSKYGLMGIHLNNNTSIQIKKYKGYVSCLCRSVDEVQIYKPEMKHVLVGPIFSYNGNLSPQFNRQNLWEASDKGLIDSKVIAYGGITDKNAHELRDLRFGGVAVYGSLAERFNPITSMDFKRVVEYFRLMRRITA